MTMKRVKFTCCRICGGTFERLSSHVATKHRIPYRDYLLEHELGGIWPSCRCGCSRPVEFRATGLAGFREYIHGHHARGRKKSEEERRKIGEANSANMRRFFAEHPDRAAKHLAEMRLGITPETEARRIESIRRSKMNMSDEEREKIAENARMLWAEHPEKMHEARAKAAQTFRGREESYRESGGFGSEQWRDRISSSVSQKYLDGGFVWSRGRHRSSKCQKECYYRSSWELRHMEELDADPTVASWTYEPFWITYGFEGRTRRYLPDFVVRYVDGRSELHEVGVEAVKGTARCLAKRAAAERYCLEHGAEYRFVSYGPT